MISSPESAGTAPPVAGSKRIEIVPPVKNVARRCFIRVTPGKFAIRHSPLTIIGQVKMALLLTTAVCKCVYGTASGTVRGA
jgi:hypothetical protein